MAASLPKNSRIIEVGAWKGKSTAYLARGAKKSGSQVYTIEDFTGVEGGSKLSRKELEKNLLGWRVKIFTKYPTLGGYMLAFIDGSHYYLSVLQDLTYVLRFSKQGAWICFHDAIGGHEGVRKVVEEIVFGGNYFTEIKYCGSIVAVKFKLDKRLPTSEYLYWLAWNFYIRSMKPLMPIFLHNMLARFKRNG